MIERLMTRPYFNKGWYLRLTLLIGQSLSLGVTLSLLIITANSLFLVDYGPQALPYVYIVVAFAGALLSYGVAALQRRWTLSRLTITTVAGLAVFFFLSWLGITALQLRWVSFALIVSFSLVIQIGFVFLGGQAGRLLDLGQIKRLFPQIVAGFVVGFLLGALAIPILVEFLGSTENVLIGQVVATLVWLAFLVVTSRRYQAELNQPIQIGRSGPAQSFFELLRKPYVQLIFLYQVLAAIVNQLSDFFLLALTAQRYDSSASLAQFISRFTVALNVTDLAVTTLIAGIFLSRFGLGAGLLSNPLVMGILFVGMLVIAPLLGLNSSLFFILVVVARIASISLTDGTTRASVNTTYQALPAHERVPIQTGVEGIGAPLALGLVGIILLAFNAIPGLSIFHLVALATLAVGAWVVTGLKVYQGYKTSLVKMVSRRVLGEAEFSLEDLSTLEAVNRLLLSDEPHHVRQALDVLESSEHESIDESLVGLLSSPNADIRAEAYTRIERRQTVAARRAVENGVNTETIPRVKGVAMRALSALEEEGAVEVLAPILQDHRPELRQAAMVGMLRYGGIAGTLAAGQLLLAMQDSPEPADRTLAAQAIGEVGARHFYQPLLPLLQDQDSSVRQAALVAAGKAPHRRLLEPVIANLTSPTTRSAAAAALAAFGDDSLPILENALAGRENLSREVIIQLLRVNGQLKGDQVIPRLKNYLNYPEEEIRHQLLVCLKNCGFQAGSAEIPAVTEAIRREAETGLRLLLASQAVGEDDACLPLQRALEGDLARLRQRLFLYLSFQHDPQAILQTERRLTVGDESERALAFEILEVSLPSEVKSLVFPLLDPNLTAAQRSERLGRIFPLPSLDRATQLYEIITNPTGAWQNEWTRACAIYAAGRLALPAIQPAIKTMRETGEGLILETATWALERLAAFPQSSSPSTP